MIDRIYIPSYGRPNKQITWNNLSDKWKEKTTIVVDESEYNEYSSLYPSVLSLPKGMKGIAPIREWIVKQATEEKISMLDDDLNFVYTRREDEDGQTNRKCNDDDMEKMFELMSTWLDEVVFCGLDATWSHPQFGIDYKFCGRVCSNVFYNTKTLPKDLEWTDLEVSEDYNIGLQLLTRGLPNYVSTRYRVSPVDNFSEGGCNATTRTLEVHNDCWIKLQKKFPNFVKVYTKPEEKSGMWKGQERLGGVVQWKKAYESSKISTLDQFMV
tara:strand:+ start:3796 stop:4602 length:807 start_codon:yes stop_codon:yes gene_type:complete